jgi:ribosome biogenesis GTP-binding protein YsxC/EngB
MNIFENEAKFAYAATSPQNLPKESHMIEINTICSAKNLARTSNTPGRTQQLNFFKMGEICYIVDMPGYGYAQVPANVKKEWEKLIVHYLSNRNMLHLVIVLVDARRGIKENDWFVMSLLEQYQKNYWIVFTKSDKVSSVDSLLSHARTEIAERITGIVDINRNVDGNNVGAMNQNDMQISNIHDSIPIFATSIKDLKSVRAFKVTLNDFIKRLRA